MKKEGESKLAVREAFRQYAEDLLDKKFGEIDKVRQTYALAHFYVSELFNRQRAAISEDEFGAAYVCACKDVGVDFLHKDDQTVYIFQFKYASSGLKTDPKEVQRFQSVFERLIDPGFKKNAALVEALRDVDFATDSFVLRYVTLSRIVGEAKEQEKRDLILPAGYEDLADRVDIDFLDEADLTDEIRHIAAFAKGVTGSYQIYAHGPRAKRSPIVELVAGDYRSCILVVAAPQILEVYKNAKDALFTLNIRNYIGATATNKAIIETSRTRPSDFFYFNNGISCVATKLEVAADGTSLTAENLQVINGAQTIKALWKGAKDAERWGGSDTAPLLLMRITEVPEGYAESGRFRTNAIRANNTQNIIKASDFRSNDPIQDDIARKFAKVRRDGRQIDYQAKRTDVRKRNSIVIRMEEFAKVVYSFVCDPVRFSGSTSFLFDDGASGGYVAVFGDGKLVWDVMPEKEFKLRSAIWWLGYAFGEQLKADRQVRPDPLERAALERKWWVIFAARLILQRSFGTEAYVDELIKTYKGDWRLGADPVGKWFEHLYTKARDAVSYEYCRAARTTPGFVHRNWMRSPSSVDDLKAYIKTALFDPLPSILRTATHLE